MVNCLAEAIINPMVDDGAFCCTAAMFCMDRVGEVPLDVRCARNEGNIVEVVYLVTVLVFDVQIRPRGMSYFEGQVEFWL